MADNVTTQIAQLSTAPAGTVIATDKIGGVDYQRVKVTWGADGTATDASAAAPLPVTVSSTALPTGAATAAKQPALGTAGTASADVISVQGIASMTALKVDGSAVTQPVSYATTGSGHAAGALRVELADNGTGTIGVVGVLTSITNPLPTGTNTLGKTYVSLQTAKSLTTASVSISSSGDNTIVSGTASQTIRIFKLVLVAAAPVSVTLKDATGGTSLTGAIPLTANGAMTIDANGGEPEFVSAPAGNFVVNLSGAVTVTGYVQYTKS